MQPKDSSNMEQLEQKILSLLNYRSGLVKEIKDIIRKKSDLGREIKNISERIRRTRETLNSRRSIFKDTKESRSEILSKIKEAKQKIRAVEEDLRNLEHNLPKREGDRLAEKIRAADWKLQTERLTREEEKQLVELVKELESKLRLWKRAYATRQDLFSLRGEMGELKEKLDETTLSREEVEIELAAERERLAYDLKAREQLFNEMGELDRDIFEIQQMIAKTDEQLEELRQRRRDAVNEKRIREKEAVKSMEREMLERVRGTAKEKLSKGEKLTFEELKLALDEDLE